MQGSHEKWRITYGTFTGVLVLDEERVCIKADQGLQNCIGKHLRELLLACYTRKYKFEFLETFNP